MTKSIIHHTPLALVAAATGVLLATSPVASAAKVDPTISTAVSGAATADIETIVNIAVAQGQAIASKAIKLTPTNVGALAGGLVSAIAAKTGTVLTTNGLDANRTANKIDESGEVAAFLLNALAGNKKLKSLGNAKKYVQSILTSAIASASSLGAAAVSDIAGSVALTLHQNLLFDKVEAKVAKAMTKSGTARKIAGANAAAFTAAFNEGLTGSETATAKFENGTNASLALPDPETDFRNS